MGVLSDSFPTCSNRGPETGSFHHPGRRFEPTNTPRASDRATAGPASRIHGPCFFPYFESFESVPGREILDISRRLTQEACKPLIFLKVLSRNDDESDGMAVTDCVGPSSKQGRGRGSSRKNEDSIWSLSGGVGEQGRGLPGGGGGDGRP